ncbi:hypothetical protein BKI52_42765 [marine bacterium AO1-C]|nr:hypothetical protein BKI52_42765 [marine bacterium AO1-C]
MNLSLVSIRRLLLICGVLCTHFAKAQVTQQEFEALKELHFYLGSSSDLFNWNFASASANDVNSSWIGLTVEGGHVTRIELYAYNLDLMNPSPGLPHAIGSFSKLKVLSLIFHDLNGTFPDFIGNLTNLEELRLQNTLLTGTLPASIGNLTKLTTLDLSGNILSGTVPVSIGNLTQLKELDLSSNSFGGAIPASIGNLTQLKKLDLSRNDFDGAIPTFVGSLTDLEQLSLSGNQLTGTIPPAINNLTKLEQLALSGNQLTGTIPATIGDLTQLEGLYLSRNQLNGTIPTTLGDLTKLEGLSLSQNQLNGTIPTTLGNLTKLEDLDLSQNQLTGPIPTTIGNLTKLEDLDLSQNQLTGTIPDLMNLLELYWIDLSNNELIGDIPSSIGGLLELSFLDFSNNDLNGTIPNEISQLTKLRTLNLSNNGLAGQMPEGIKKLTKLEYLYLANNKLQGTLPTEIGILTLIKEIELQNNQLSSLPDLSEKPTFAPTVFKVDNNQLHFGHILPNISKLSSYAPQAKYIPKVTTITLEEGETLNIDGFVEGSSNHYKWYRADGKEEFSGQEFYKQKIARQDAGDYVCKVTNPTAPDLTLESQLVTIEVTNAVAPTLVSVTPANGSSLPNGNITFTIRFSEKIKIGSGEVLLKRASDHHIVQRYEASDLTITSQDRALTFSSRNLAAAAYYITMPSGCVTDLGEHPFAGIANATTWSFSIPDREKPVITTFFPANNSTQVNTASLSTLKITFSETIVKGTGYIHIKRSRGNTTAKSIDVQSSQVIIQGKEVTINLGGLLNDEISYYVTVPATAFKDAGDNHFDGLQESTDWQFTLGNPQQPTVVQTSPRHHSTDVSVSIASLGITFSETVALGTSGEVELRKVANDEVVAQVSVQFDNISLDDQSANILLDKSLEPNTQYYVRISPGSFQDLAGWEFAGINNKTTWQFTTSAQPPLIETFYPAHQSTVSAGFNTLTMHFSEPMQKGVGSINLYAANDDLAEAVQVSSSAVTIDGKKVSIELDTSKLQPNTTYYVRIPSSAFRNTPGNEFVGLEKGDWEFKTAMISDITNQSQAAIQVHPNPTTDIVQITLKNNDTQELQFEVMTHRGKVIRSGTLEKGSQKSIDTSTWPQGHYLLRFQVDKTIIIKRLVKK